MQPWNKQNLISFGLVLAIAVVAFCTIAAITIYFKNGGAFWPIPLPVVAIVYACVAFYKKYNPGIKY